MPLITSANVGCGFHGGDPVTMARTVALAKNHGGGVGAHPALAYLMGVGMRVTTGGLAGYRDRGKVKTTEGKELDISAKSVSVHGDTMNAPAALRVMRIELKSHGVEVTSIRNIV